MQSRYRLEKPSKNSKATNPNEPRLYPDRRSPPEKLEAIFETLRQVDWSLGAFLYHLFREVDEYGDPVKISPSHLKIVGHFLQGTSRVKALDIVKLIYSNGQSRPNYQSAESGEMFSVVEAADSFAYAGPAISCWAVELVMEKMKGELRKVIRDPDLRVRAGRKGAVLDLLNSAGDVVAPEVVGRMGMAEVEELEMERTAIDGMGGQGHGNEDGGRDPLEQSGDENEDWEDVDEETPSTSLPEGGGIDPPTEKRQRGEAADALASWDVIGKFSIKKLVDKYKKISPVIWHLVSSLTAKPKRRSSRGTYRPTDAVSHDTFS